MMLRRLVFRRQPWHRQPLSSSWSNLLLKSTTTFPLHPRYLSNESLKETLKKVQQEKQEREAESATAAGEDATSSSSSAKDKEEETTKAGPDATEVLNKVMEFVRNARQVIDENLRIAWGEMTGSTKESVLERKFEQAESFRRGKKEGEETS